MISDLNNVLVLAPHPDDGEFGCGGSISKLIKNNVKVHYVAFSYCEKSILPQYPSNILISEVEEATEVLGVQKENLHIYNFDVRTFNYNRQKILDKLINIRGMINPDLVFIPSINDVHQDHSTIANEALRAFKFTNILSYEMPWNNFQFSTTCFITLDQNDLNKKIQSIKKYKSQKHRTYSDENFIRSMASVRGVQIGEKYAEVFEVVRLKY